MIDKLAGSQFGPR